MKRGISILFTLLLLSLTFVYGQNLVQNPSFEDTTVCPNGPGQLSRAKFWVNPTHGTPDYYNSCYPNLGISVPYTMFGYQPSRTGVAIAGFYAFAGGGNVREYVQTKLSDTLTSGHKYLVSFYVNLSNVSQYSLSSIGAYLSSIPVANSNTLMLSYTAQIQNSPAVQLSDSINWMLIQDTLISNGTEQYITIGNFKPDSLSDTTYLGWFSSANIAYYYIDDVSVIDIESLGIKSNNNKQKHTEVYPNPTSGKVYISGFSAGDKTAFVEVMDVTGKIVLKHNGAIVNAMLDLPLPLNNGVYFLKITTSSGTQQIEKVILSK